MPGPIFLAELTTHLRKALSSVSELSIQYVSAPSLELEASLHVALAVATKAIEDVSVARSLEGVGYDITNPAHPYALP
jgi:hypothetical protein